MSASLIRRLFARLRRDRLEHELDDEIRHRLDEEKAPQVAALLPYGGDVAEAPARLVLGLAGIHAPVGVGLFLAATLAAWIPARTVAHADPAATLRHE